MSPSENEDDPKLPQDSDPLCLFYFSNTKKSYLSCTKGSEDSKTQKLANSQRISPWKLASQRRDHQSSSDETLEKTPTRKRKNKISRRRFDSNTSHKRKPLRKPKVHHLTSYLLHSGQPVSNETLPSLTNVLEAITDAWPETNQLQLNPINNVEHKNPPTQKMMERRRSVPEEIIRQYNVRKERTSESETNATMPEVTPPSSNDKMRDNTDVEPSGPEKLRAQVFSQKIEDDLWPLKQLIKERSFKIIDDEVVRSAEEGSSDSDSDAPGMERFNTIKRAPLRRGSVIDKSLSTETRVSQNDYYKNGKGILKISEKSSQTGDCICRYDSETTPSAREESESGESSETISSPRLCTKPLSSSDNQSSDSEDIKCTCAEITSSKGTSTDLYHSGKSTLSQTVSDKSTSTQDSTASINSISSRGSSITAATDSSSTDIDPRTSAKETTTSPDHTPRPPQNGHTSNKQDPNGKHCPQHKPHRGGKNQSGRSYPAKNQNNYRAHQTPRFYEWAQLSQEEINLIQQQRHKKFMENDRNFESPLTSYPEKVPSNVSDVSTVTGSSYPSTGLLNDLSLMVPRYSALPRSMSMVVNSSSQDASHYSDSDCQSLADSLEDGQNATTYFDTKQELKPVRGDIDLALAERTKKINQKKEPKGRAYFFSIDNEGDAKLVTNIHKIPEPPKEIKNKIRKRHVSLAKRIEAKEPTKEIITKPKLRKQQKQENLTPPTVRVSDKKQKETELKKLKSPPKKMNETRQDADVTTPRKPQAVIQPSPQTCQNQSSEPTALTPDEDMTETITRQRQSLITSLESTANVLRAQQKQWPRNQQPVKRPSKFQQRFEVIPEERSSSLTSSAEDPRSEINRRLSLPVKLSENSTNATFLSPESGGKSFRRYTLGSIPKSVISQLMGRPLQAIPCVQRGPNNENQQIIIFSPKDPPASTKGRDALLAMNREDFNRLSKGWMNFYLLKESSDSENEDKKAEEEEREKELEPNTIVCRIPSMEKDPPTTSGSGTDETSISPGRNQLQNKSYSLLLKNPETNCFQLEEVDNPKEIEPSRQVLSFISEEPESAEEAGSQKDASTEVDDTLSKTPKKLTKEASTSTEKKLKPKPTESSIKLSAPLKLGSSNTVLTTKKAIKVSPRKTPKTSGRACSLPELKSEIQKKPTPVKTQSMIDPLPNVSVRGGHGDDDSDSDSTIYLNAPSPQVPRLPIEDCCDFYSDSSSCESTRGSNHAPREKTYVPLRRRPLPFRPKNRFGFSETVRGKKPGWSVTVEGTLAFPITRPDVQMKLSFPRDNGPPFVSQSDSGFVEDRDANPRTNNQKWTVTVKNPTKGSGKEHHKTGCLLPNLNHPHEERSIKRGPKETATSQTNTQRTDINKKLSKIWPKVQKIIESELTTITSELLNQKPSQEPLISVEGRAMSLDVKPRAPKMSQRDLTRNTTTRSESFKKT